MTPKPCTTCPYKLGLVKTFVNPCLQCKQNGYEFYYMLKAQEKPKKPDDKKGV